jgi:hypothetical protein
MSDFCASEMPTPMADHSQQLADGERVLGFGLVSCCKYHMNDDLDAAESRIALPNIA